ncbi:MAG: type 1 glutamine amidotransferase [candidate division WS1 bacterium]|jgi:protease I|nr:type 1 glutamine amidotransferase [candidate division WS1 bacterium]
MMQQGAQEGPLAGKVVAILVEEGFHDQELDVPRQRLLDEGAQVVLVGTEAGKTYEDYRGQKFFVTADISAQDADPGQFHGLVIPGGKAPGLMRENQAMLDLTGRLDAAGKPIAAICHGPWVVVAAEIVRRRPMTSVASIAEDLVQAGAQYRDEPVVIADNLITSRTPADLQPFCDALVEALKS